MMDEGEMYFDKDDETLVKVNIVDDNNPSETTCAEIPQEYYDRIMSGQSSLRKELDKDGNIQFVLVDVNPPESIESLSTLNKVINNTTNLHSLNHAEEVQMHKKKSVSLSYDSKYVEDIEVDHSSAEHKLMEKDDDIKGEEYLITEYPSTGDFFVVVISDSNRESIFEKAGQIGDTLTLDLCGHTISYLISGPNDDGTVRQTNVYIDQSDADKSGDLTSVLHPDQQIMMEAEEMPDGQRLREAEDENEEEYIISEESVLVDDEHHQQMVTLSDKHHNVFDTKYGIKGETVKLHLTDKAFEYAIQGPMDNGEPIITTFLLNKGDDEGGDVVEPHSPSEVEDPAAQWCPPELSKEDYAAIRDAARHIAATLESANELPAVQPYSEQLGSLPAYQDLVSLVERYKSRAEERRTDLQLLRRHSKLYMPVKPSARKLTRLEWARNEAAAQVCRYVPALLFHKRRLYECALAVVERSGLFPKEVGRQSDIHEELSDDTRPFTGPVAVTEEAHSNLPSTTTRSFPQSSVVNANSYMSSDMGPNNPFNQAFPSFGKRDLQLTCNEETAIKNAAERLQEELYQYPIKTKSDCMPVELQIRNELVGLQDLIDGSPSEVEQAHEYMRESSAVNGRFLPSQRGRHQPLSPYDVAVNEAAYHLVRNNIGLLTYRKVLTDLARKVVRASGCNFRHNTMGDKKEYNAANLWLYNQDNVPELDLSSAIKVLSDPLEESPFSCSLQSSFVPVIEEIPVKSEDEEDVTEGDDVDEVYRPRQFRDMELLGNVHMECESERNILNECAIYSHTGTDDLKKVRILDLHNCSFTSIMPIDINYCYNLVELNLYDNALSYLPRCLFLPNLVKLNLRRNRFVTVPLLEQFPKLCSLEIDEKVARKLNKESLTFFCADLAYINNKKFVSYISEDFNSIFLEAKTYVEAMVQSRWEEDLSMYFKKGVTKSESQKVIETLVLSIRERRIFNETKFFNFKDLIARRVAENFLDSKIIDDDDDEEYKEKLPEEMDSDEDEETNEINRCSRSRNQKKNEFDNQTVEKGQILLNDEPLDRLTNVVGQALRSGKTVVYSVMRTAARQPGGDLIPVGGGDNSQNNNYLLSSKKTTAEEAASAAAAAEKSCQESIRTRPGPASFKKRRYGITPSLSDTDEDACTRETVQRLIDDVMEKVESFNTNVKRRVGRPRANRDVPVSLSAKKELFKVPRTLIQPPQEEPQPVVVPPETPMSVAGVVMDTGSSALKKDKKPSEELRQRLEQIVRTCESPVTPGKIREMLGLGLRGRPSSYVTEASQRTYLKHNQEMPEAPVRMRHSIDDLSLESFYEGEPMDTTPHRPSSTMKVATRVSNQFKKFHQLGVQQLDDSAFSSDNDEKPSQGPNEADYEYTPTPKHSKESPTAESRTSDGSDLAGSEASFLNELRRSQAEKDRQGQRPSLGMHRSAPVAQGVVVSLPASTVFNPVRDRPIAPTSGPRIPDYDPLHFIRCHARDNNPLDSATKVWRCAFEPNPANPYMETTSVVATCGGECVCLIDCHTGKVMKRFKSREEEFYTVAWTTVEMAAGHHINILAAGGKMRDIRLLHPEQLVCYAEMKGHEQEIACMTFHPRYPTVLFSGDAMANVLVWDIGVPAAPDYTTQYQLLVRLMCPRAHLNPVLNLVVMPSYDALVAGCEDGVFVWLFPEFRRCKPADIRPPDFEVKVPTHQEPCFDGLARLSENTLLVKCVEEGEIFTINFPQIIQHYKARKFDDHSRVVADVIGWLRWQITDEIYINVTAQMNLCAVLCGDNEGTIWLYDMAREVADEHNTKKFKTKPLKILDWPECSVESSGGADADGAGGSGGKKIDPDKNPIINCVEMSSDGTYLVAVTDNNLVCIWSVPGHV